MPGALSAYSSVLVIIGDDSVIASGDLPVGQDVPMEDSDTGDLDPV